MTLYEFTFEVPCVFYPKCRWCNWHVSFLCNAAYLREGIQGLPDGEQQSGGRGVRPGGKGGGETASRAGLTQGFGNGAKKTNGHTAGALPQRGSFQLRGSHTQRQAHSRPAQHPPAGLGPQVGPCAEPLSPSSFAVVASLHLSSWMRGNMKLSDHNLCAHLCRKYIILWFRFYAFVR